MQYVTRPGVEVIKVCGTRLLVPDRDASEYCPYIVRLSALMAADWGALKRGVPVENLYKAHAILRHKPVEEVREGVDLFLNKLC